MPKKNNHQTSSDLVVGATPVAYPIANTEIAATQLFANPDRHPRGHGPWTGEADKVGWIDQHTGMACIILRRSNGTLSGYVAVTPNHPLHGYRHDAIPGALEILVHGGLSYAEPCEETRPERISVCHVRIRKTPKVTRKLFEDEDLWWFGFDTDHAYDFVPAEPRRPTSDAKAYRNQDYVYRECIKLAAQLYRVETDIEVEIPVELQQPTRPLGGSER